jgi:hypothetical protein
MASAKQIAANRANAQRSTGPTTALGKMKSSRNSFRHGLSWPLPPDLATSSKVEALARALTPRDAGDAEWTSAMEFATAQIELVLLRHNFWSPVFRSIGSATRTARQGFDDRVDQAHAHGCD